VFPKPDLTAAEPVSGDAKRREIVRITAESEVRLWD
jgi:hypothetical protein